MTLPVPGATRSRSRGPSRDGRTAREARLAAYTATRARSSAVCPNSSASTSAGRSVRASAASAASASTTSDDPVQRRSASAPASGIAASCPSAAARVYSGSFSSRTDRSSARAAARC
ncbi:hypothetical protein [Streptomyces sp. LN785]|uniref:hypothetical protein n=1 Tax=Streptomyces sp. LN785 TaxID=3112983 RepID=UPI003721A207